MSEKIFILGSMPADAKSDLYIAAGEWCFARQEKFFPSWETDFEIARCYSPETDAEAFDEARRAIGWGVQLLHEYTEDKNAIIKEPLPPDVWEFLAGTIFISLGLNIAYAYNTVQLWVNDYKNLSLTVPLCSAYSFTDYRSLKRDIYEPDGMHWLFSEMLCHMAPSNWNLIPGKEPCTITPADAKSSSSSLHGGGIWKETFVHLQKWIAVKRGRLDGENALGLKGILKGILSNLFSWLYPLQHTTTYSASFWQSVCIKTALLANRNRKNDRELLKEEFGVQKGEYPDFCKQIALKMIPAYINTIEDGVYKKKSICKTFIVNSHEMHGKEYASLLWGGARLVVLQHSPVYAILPMNISDDATELMQHRFGAWGKCADISRSVRLPSFYYNRIADSHTEKMSTLYCVSRLHEFPCQMVASGFCSRVTVRESRNDLARFIGCLPSQLRVNTLLRPYIYPQRGFDSARWAQRLFPDIACHTEGGLASLDMMKQCRVAAINYLGSAFGQALILNTPLVLFFRLGSYTLTPSGYEVLQSFQEAGIFHETPEQAASFIARIWDSVPDWWNSDVVQAARKEYLRLDADAAGDDILWTWVKNALRV